MTGLKGGKLSSEIVFGQVECEGCVYTKDVENVSADTLMQHIAARMRNGSLYFTDTFRGY